MMKLWRRIGGLLAVTTMSLVGATGCDGRDPTPAGPSAAEVDRAISLASEHLFTMLRADGQFVYRANLDPSIVPPRRYNLLRHAGTVYALAEAVRRSPDAQRLAQLRRAAAFLRLQVYPMPELPGEVMAVVSDPAVTGASVIVKAKLGGSGLGLAALLRVETLAPGTTPDRELRGLAEFLLFMQEPDGSFHDHYLPGLKQTWSPIDSLYYPGEAALALAMLHDRDGDTRWVDAARRALLYLGRTRADWPLQKIPADHWALLATADVLPQTPDPQERTILLEHARRVVRSILAQQIHAPADHPAVGSFDEHGHTTPTATRMEGLLAALTFLPEPGDADLRRQVQAAVRSGMAFLVRSQVREGRWAGAMPRNGWASETVGPRSTEIRIDYAQHCLSALMQYQDVMLAEQGEAR